MRALKIFVALSLLDLAAGLPAAGATTFVLVRSEAVAGAADRAVRGTVVAVETRWRGARIQTRVRLRTTDGDVWFEHPGGTVDGVTMQVVGMPAFAPGEDVIVLVAERAGSLRLIGLSEGKLAVVQRDGRAVVMLRLEDDGPLTALAVDDGLRRLRRAVAAAHPVVR